MTEIYKNSSNYAYLDLEGTTADATPTAVYIVDPDITPTPLDVVLEASPPDGVQRWVATLNATHSAAIGDFTVRWEFSVDGIPIVQESHFEVVTPLVGIGTIRDELELTSSTTDDELVLTERRVRRVIENYTRQRFDLRYATRRIKGTRDPYLRLPERLETLESVSVGGFIVSPSQLSLDETGRVLYRINVYPSGSIYLTEHVIDDPYHVAHAIWNVKTPILITGYWGWPRVPSQIQEAALILLEERLCPESGYRDRYLTSMTAADWRIQFHPDAFRGTGNVIADNILNNYVVRNMAVV